MAEHPDLMRGIRGQVSLRFLEGGGEMGMLIRSHDWANSGLGPPHNWPEALRTVVHLILNTQHPMTVWWGAEGTCLYNDSFRQALGSEQHPGSLGRPAHEAWREIWDIIGPDVERVKSGQGAVWHRDRFLPFTQDGQRREGYWTYSYSPIHDQAAEAAIGGILVVCSETTHQVVAAKQLAFERNRLAQLFDEAPTFMVLLRGPDHRIELANTGYVELIGHHPIIGKSIAETMPEAVKQGYVALLDSVFQTGMAYAANSAKYAFQLAPDGPITEKYVDFVYQPIKDPDGVVTGIFVNGADVTDRARATEALRRAKERLETQVEERSAQLHAREALIRTFYDHSSECHAVLTETASGGFRYEEINPAALRLYGKTRDEVIGFTTNEIFGDTDGVAALNGHLAACLAANAPHRYERSQGPYVLEAVATPVPQEAGIERRVVVSAREVTDRRRLEEQLRQAQKMEAVGQLTGGIAHDFNNLLAGISGSLELIALRLGQGRLGDVDRFIVAAQASAKRAVALTQRLLAFSRRQTLAPKPTDLNRLISGMEDLVRRTLGPSIELEVVGARELWPTMVDPPLLESALLNLCINGRDAMAPGGGKLTIETTNKSLDERAARELELACGQYVLLCVTDTGTGMDANVIVRAFDPFFTTKPLGEGTGLGLSMVYGFARQSGGQVRIDSEVGKGTTICLYLPRHMGHTKDDEKPDPSLSLSSGLGETVLVVDDEATVRMLIKEVLEENGYTVVTACDGPAGLKILQSDARINLLITDVGLPGGINGRQIADAARVTRSGLKVLFITGYAENAAIGNGLLAIGMEVLTKPFAMEALGQKVRQLIDR